ncbi:ecotin [Thalassotalea agarivorans]|uniref:Ecotin n=1 Tax=Thalassotalea agarivorans TaxID=349064 RepID=A0A1H9Y8K6_THASX|nr:ecotin [Thalassotalea agarivorans]
MKTNMHKLVLFIASLLIQPSAQATDYMKAFPVAEGGALRYVLKLPEKENESLLKIELVVGKIINIDQENRYFFAGAIKEETIKGWGFVRYVVSDLGPMAGTMMAVAPSAPISEHFITLGGKPYLIP